MIRRWHGLGYLARRVGDLPLALVLGLRSGDPGGERAELARLVGDGAVERIVLGPLSASGVGAVVRGTLDEEADEPFCAACCELTGGNPLFVRELLAAARDEGVSAREAGVEALRRIVPAGVEISVLARLGRLGGDAVALARAVAVLGPGSEVMLAARLASLDRVVAELAADRLGAAQIFALTRPLEFIHPLIGEAVAVDIAPGERRVSHRRAAELLDRGGGSLGHVAAHLLESGPSGDQWVLGRLRDAASEALERGAPEIAMDYLRRALREPPADAERAPLLLMLGTAEWRTGEADAISDLERALALADEDPATLIGASSLLAEAYNVSNRHERAVEVLERGLAAVGDSDPGLTLTA